MAPPIRCEVLIDRRVFVRLFMDYYATSRLVPVSMAGMLIAMLASALILQGLDMLRSLDGIEVLTLACFIAFVGPIGVLRLLAHVKSRAYAGQIQMSLELSGERVTATRDGIQTSYEWQDFEIIRETKQHFFLLCSEKKGSVSIVKWQMSSDTLDSIRGILLRAPVPRKRLAR